MRRAAPPVVVLLVFIACGKGPAGPAPTGPPVDITFAAAEDTPGSVTVTATVRAAVPVAILRADIVNRMGRVLDAAVVEELTCVLDEEGAFVSGTLFTSGAWWGFDTFDWSGERKIRVLPVLRAGEELLLRGNVPAAERRVTVRVTSVPLASSPGLLALDPDSIRAVAPPSGGSPRAERQAVKRAAARYRPADEPNAGGGRRVSLGPGGLPTVWPHAFRDGEPAGALVVSRDFTP